eukprot:TRINITY_DN44186_c0_g1_i1.p1 TRINITY_DN44186_c0_g1~~TRINITY_DN44186_c0_g1_i1.p1  ORF type:complete len:456 (+),score=97.02 TRINITY_DN44186_c0_g1_i1:100-1467(+)
MLGNRYVLICACLGLTIAFASTIVSQWNRAPTLPPGRKRAALFAALHRYPEHPSLQSRVQANIPAKGRPYKLHRPVDFSVRAAPAAAPASADSWAGCQNLLGSIDTRRGLWEKTHKRPFPGRGWAQPAACPNSGSARRAEAVMRGPWVSDLVRRSFPRGAALRGAEIGACAMPVPVPRRVNMSYIDHTAERTRNCFETERSVGVDIVADAVALEGIPDASFDLLIAFHVLEHMHDVVRSMAAWLRVLRPGGLLVLGVPDACSWEQLRLVTSPEHFVEDYQRGISRDAAEAMHWDEAILTKLVGALFLQQRAVLSGFKDVPDVNFPLCGWNYSTTVLAAIVRSQGRLGDVWENFVRQRGAAAHVFNLPVEAAFKWGAEQLRKDTMHAHLHVWNQQSMADMLNRMSALRGVPEFEVLDLHTSGSSAFQMQELHVALRRLPPRAGSPAGAAPPGAAPS